MTEQMQVFEGVTSSFNFKEVVVKAQKRFIVCGYISTMDVDLVGDQVTSECLQDMLAQIQAGNVKMDWEHETILEQDLNKVPRARIIPETALVDGKGLWVEAEINPDHSDFTQLWNNIKNKFLDAFSIAFRPVEAVTQWVGDKAIRILNKIKLINVGITGNPVNEEATMEKVYIKALGALSSGLLAPPGEEAKDVKTEEEVKETEKKALTHEGQQVYAGEKSNLYVVAEKFSKNYDIEKEKIEEGLKDEMIQLDAVNNDMDTIAQMVVNRLKADSEHYSKLRAIENRESYSTEEKAEESEEKSEVSEVYSTEDKGTMEEAKTKQKYDEDETKPKEDYKSDLASIKSDIESLKAEIETLKGMYNNTDKEKMKRGMGDYEQSKMGKEHMYGKDHMKAEESESDKDTEAKSVWSEIKSLKSELAELKAKPVMKSLHSEVPTKLNEKELPSVMELIR